MVRKSELRIKHGIEVAHRSREGYVREERGEPLTVFKLPGGWGVEPRGGRVSTSPHLSFGEVGMLLDSHFLLMQFLKYLRLHHDDLILLHLDSYCRLLLSSPGL